MKTMRRGVLAMAAASLLGGAAATAQDKPETLTILSHRVHQTVSTQGAGGDITARQQDRAAALGLDKSAIATIVATTEVAVLDALGLHGS